MPFSILLSFLTVYFIGISKHFAALKECFPIPVDKLREIFFNFLEYVLNYFISSLYVCACKYMCLFITCYTVLTYLLIYSDDLTNRKATAG